MPEEGTAPFGVHSEEAPLITYQQVTLAEFRPSKGDKVNVQMKL